MNRTLGLLSIVIVLAIRAATAKDTCPPKELLHPCVCIQDMRMTIIRCSNISSMETLVDVFERSGDVKFKYFVLDHSSLMYLPAASLQSKRFKRLLIENVTLTSMFDKVPSTSNELEILTLSQAFLQRGVQWYLLENLSKLAVLQVVKTEVKTLGRSFMRYVGDKKITDFLLMETKTAQLDDHVFNNLTTLEDLRILDNKIKTLKRSMFSRPAAIKNFVFQNNEIETLPDDIFSDMPYLKIVLLQNNKISKFSEPTFGGVFEQLTILSMESNPINCDCSMEWFLTRTERSRVFGTCDRPLDKKGRQISDINKADLEYCHQSSQSRTNMLETILDE